MSWRCATCWKWAASKDAATTECAGPPQYFANAVAAAKRAGHSVAHLVPKQQGTPAMVICIECGAMATRGAKCWSNLLTVCKRGVMRHKNVASTIRRAAEAQHPKKGRFGDEQLYYPAVVP